MFTGIVEELGEVAAIEGGRLVVACRTLARDADVGASVAVNGTCLTVVANGGDALAFDLSGETLARTSLGRLSPGASVNLERPVTLGARLGGHLVQGHVDDVGEVVAREPDGAGGALLKVRVPAELLRYVVEKGSIAVDGVSLTAAALDGAEVAIALIPHTLAATTLGTAAPGDPVNLEVDVIAKYVERLLSGETEGRVQG
ncbi:MAG: riboflavin synthase [Actinobacteria bacterium]|nr:riboflavin synthase [Actinomycetota bacterium]